MNEEPDSIEQLKRIAFGPDATPAERAAAEESLRRLDEQELATAAAVNDESVAENPPPDQTADGAGVLANDANDDDGADRAAVRGADASVMRRSIRAAWLIPIVVASLVLGYLAGLGTPDTAPQGGSKESPAPSASSSENLGTILQLGGLEAADSWFNGTFKASDAVPNPETLEALGLSTQDVRLAVFGGDKGSVWVGRTAAELCLIIEQSLDGAGASTCIERDTFARVGIALASMDHEVKWFGRDVITNPPLGSTATNPLGPTLGPGDVDAANLWFAVPASSSDEFPHVMLLKNMHVDQSDVRRVVPESAPWMKLWVAMQSTGGFCLLSTDDADASGQGACSATEDFQKNGLATMAQGHSVFWDGTSLSVSG